MSLKKSTSMEMHTLSITPEEVDEAQELEKLSLCSKIKNVLNFITVEPMMICYLLPNVLLSFTTLNLGLDKVCRVNLGLDEGTCDALNSRNQSYPGYRTNEKSVQTLAANVDIWKNVIQGFFTALLLLFLGSWSDRNKKRKPLMMNPMLGGVCCCTGLLLSTYFFFELPVQFNVIVESIPYALTGGWFSMYVGTFSYVSEVSSNESRTTRIGAVQIAVNISLCVGMAVSGVMFHKTGYYGVLLTSLAIFFSGYLYGLLFIKDIWELEMQVVEGVEEGKKKKSFLADFFDTKHVVDTFRIVFKNGKRNRRARVCCVLILAMLVTGPLIGEQNVSYYYVSYKFGWNAGDTSIFGTFHHVTQIFGAMFCLALLENYLKVDDSILGVISSGCKIVAAFLYAFGPSPVYYYLGAFIELLNTTSSIAMRSIMSKLVPRNELGKVNSVISLVESFVPTVYGSLYSKVYAATITVFPGAFWMTGAALTVPALLIFSWLYTEHRKDEREAHSQVQEADISSTPK